MFDFYFAQDIIAKIGIMYFEIMVNLCDHDSLDILDWSNYKPADENAKEV